VENVNRHSQTGKLVVVFGGTGFLAAEQSAIYAGEKQLEQIGHQDASLRRPLAASTPNRIFGTH
jgi:hypothetical protein